VVDLDPVRLHRWHLAPFSRADVESILGSPMPGVTGLPGTALLTREGSVRAELAGGLADAEAALPCTAATRFQLCSVAKQFTAAAVLLLAEAGWLDLHE